MSPEVCEATACVVVEAAPEIAHPAELTADEIEEVANAATKIDASAQARKPWAVSRKKTSSVCRLVHFVRNLPAK